MMVINDRLVHRLISDQFPQWAGLPIRPVAVGGWDNRIFHLGEYMLVRMPSAADYAMQVEKEHRWLPVLAPFLPLPISKPLAIGKPAAGYPRRWSIYQWLEGETVAAGHIADPCHFASSLAQFLAALQGIDATGGPPPGAHNFHRGGALTVYDAETRRAINDLKDKIDADAAFGVWETALATTWRGSPVWVHGDVSAGNLLLQNGQLSAVIDFGQLSVGDPSCDLAIAWTLFEGKSRETFRTMLPLDADTWARGRAWALWKALIVAAKITNTNAVEAAQSWSTIERVLADYVSNRY